MVTKSLGGGGSSEENPNSEMSIDLKRKNITHRRVMASSLTDLSLNTSTGSLAGSC